ncbi:(2Fe-2S)-binding protein [Vibrio marisflavi]|uniref:Hydrogen cyanide synthase subunit HcnA n=1 Tax=Vibrio marisflavi CECT 7928 TaxID=634439 RepID=A0ABM8ZZ02_9VIBR|nr:(2Fe-2S)-binding protein [Vibrio marisflavi]CAH0536069.1 Hydrogen cyanide synthase subunit HcnA [Vibrio marisflavi CECT 7928]
MKANNRIGDIVSPAGKKFVVNIDDREVEALPGESVISTLTANGFRKLMKNDKGTSSGSYCAMGVCHCCMVEINGIQKQRACQTLVQPGMKIKTLKNRVVDGQGEKHEQ